MTHSAPSRWLAQLALLLVLRSREILVYALAIVTIAIGIATIIMLAGCSGSQRPDPLDVASTTIRLAGSAADAIEPLIPADRLAAEREERCGDVPASECADALELARQAVSVAETGVTAARQINGPPSQWPVWVASIGEALVRLLDLLKAIGVPIPGWVSVIVGSIPLLAGLFGSTA